MKDLLYDTISVSISFYSALLSVGWRHKFQKGGGTLSEGWGYKFQKGVGMKGGGSNSRRVGNEKWRPKFQKGGGTLQKDGGTNSGGWGIL